MAARLAENYLEPEVRQILEWKPASAARAEVLADSGQLSSAADLCERIIADDRVSGVLTQRTSIARLPLSFSGGSTAAVKALEDDFGFWKIVPANQLQLLHRWFAVFGIALGRLRWADDAGRPLMAAGLHAPRVEAWSTARHLERDQLKRIWTCEVGNGGKRETVDPGANGWLLWTAASERPWALGSWRACRPWWILKGFAEQDWGRYSERQGQGTSVLEDLEGLTTGSSDSDSKAKRARLAREMRTMGSNGTIVLPKGFRYSLVEAVARTWEGFQKQIEAANAGLAIANLGQNLTSEVKSGSLASSRVHETVAANIIATDAESLSDFTHDQILVPWAIANWGSADAAPWPVWDASPPDDFAPKVQSWVQVGVAIKQFREEGVPADSIAMAEQAGVPLIAGGEMAEPTTPAAEQAPTTMAQPPEARRRHQPRAAGKANLRKGERAGLDYTDRIVASVQDAMAQQLSPHLQQILSIVENCGGDYQRAREQLVALYAWLDPEVSSQAVKAGLVLCQLAGLAAVRVDAPEV